MEKVLIASSDQSELDAICESLVNDYTTDMITSPEEYTGNLNEYDLLLLDQNFTDFQGVDFLMTVLMGATTPALVLAPPEDVKSVGEALNVGALNFIIKSESYLEVLPLAISDSIKRFTDQKSMQDTIASLKKEIGDLVDGAKKTSTVSGTEAQTSVAPEERNLLADVVATLKSGEINLPIYPNINSQFKVLMNRAASVKEIIELLQKDPSISSKMISVANSSYYRGMKPIKTLDQAINRVGIAETRNYVELIGNRDIYSTSRDSYKQYLDTEWKHSLCCGYVSQELSRAIQFKNPAELFSMGLFHGIGKNILVQILSQLENNGTYTEISEEEWRPLVEKHYSQFGASLMKKWNLSSEYWLVARWHEDPSAAGEDICNELRIISLAKIIAKDMGYHDLSYEVNIDYNTLEVLTDLNITPEGIEHIKKSVKEMMETGLEI